MLAARLRPTRRAASGCTPCPPRSSSATTRATSARCAWSIAAALREAGLEHLVEIRHSDYRDVTETGFDKVSSIGLTEHIGVKNYPDFFRFLNGKLKPGGLMLNHCITYPDNHKTPKGGFIDRYIFPDGELAGAGTVHLEAENAGF